MEIANVEAAEAWDGHEGERLGRARRPLRALVAAPPAAPDQPRRSSDRATGCSTSGAAPGWRRSRRRSSPREGSALGDRPLLADARPRPRARRSRGRRATSPSCRATPRCTRSSPVRPTSRSASAAPCSSATRSPPSPTSPRASDRAVGWRCWRGGSSDRNEWLTTRPWRARARARAPHTAAGRPHAVLAGRPRSRAGAPRGGRVRRHPARCRRRARSSSARTPTMRSRGSQDGRHRRGAPRRRRRRRPGRRALDNLHAAFKEAETSEGVLLGTSAWLITATRS